MNKDKQDDVGEPIVQGVVTATRVLTDVDKQVEALLAGSGVGDLQLAVSLTAVNPDGSVAVDADQVALQTEAERIEALINEILPDDEERDEEFYGWKPRKKTPAEVREDAKRNFFGSKIQAANRAEMPVELADLEEDYLKWRGVIFTRIFNAKVWPDSSFYAQRHGTALNYEKEKAKWLANVDRPKAVDGYDSDTYPERDYFRRKIVPLAIYMNKHNGKDLKEVAEHAVETYKKMMRMSTYGGTMKTVHRGVIRSIFAVEHAPGGHGHNSGQYRFFYNKYGKWAAYAATVFQADISDEHYDGGNYTVGTYRLEEIFGNVAKLVPEEFREFVFKGAVNYGGHHGAEKFLRRLPEVIEEIKKAGREDILPLFYRFLEAAHPLEYRGNGFPIFDAKHVIREMTALAKTKKYKDEILEAANEIVRIGERSFGSAIPSFIKRSSKNEESFYHRNVNFPTLIKKLEEEGCDEETIKMVLALPKNYPWLGDEAYNVMWNYKQISSNFSGGFEAFLKYLEENKSASRSKGSMIEIAKSEDFAQPERDLILEEGAEVVKLFGYFSQAYFGQFGDGIGKQYNRGIRLLADKPEEFRAALKEIHELVAKCGDKFEGDDPREKILERLYRYHGAKNYEALAKGYEIIIGKLTKLLKTKKAAHEDRHGLFDDVIEHYGYLSFSLKDRGIDDDGFLFSSELDYEAHAKVLADFALCRKGVRFDFREMYNEYIQMVKNGVSLEMAALTVIVHKSLRKKNFDKLCKKYGVSEDKAKLVFDAIISARDLINRVDSGEEVMQLEIRSARRKLEEVTVDEEMSQYLKKDAYLEDLDRIAKTNFFKEACRIGIGSGTDLDNTGTLMRTTNQSTKMAIGGVSILLSAGAMQFDNMEEGIVPLPVDSSTSLDQLSEILMDGRYSDVLRRNIATVLPRLEGAVLSERAKMPGLLPVGAKIHTHKEVDESALSTVENMFGLPRGTCFRLIHANRTLLLPPLPSELEMRMLIQTLASFGVIDLNLDDIQICAAGRRPEENAAIVGSATVLSRNIGRTYAKGAFTTTHFQTGARIMAYDAGVKNEGLPFDSTALPGRTDILGTSDLTDIPRFQIGSTIAAHEETGMIFAPLMRDFKEDYLKVLKRAGLDAALRQSAWVFDNAQKGDNLDNHEHMIRRFTDQWMYASGRPGLGVIADVKRLLAGVKGQIQAAAPIVIARNREEFDRLLKY